VFAAHEVTVAARFEVAMTRLTLFLRRGALPAASEAAYTRGLVAGLRTAPFGVVQGLSKLVRVRCAAAVQRDDVITMPLRWEVTGPAGELFPVLDADLTLTGDGDGETRIRLDASYRPPFALGGEALDRAVVRRLAAATLQFLVECVADAVADPVPELRPEEPPAQWWPEAGER
jgi:hypothetical protein